MERSDLLYTGRDLPVDEIARLLVATAEHAVCRPLPGQTGPGTTPDNGSSGARFTGA